jgi:hypothetical protein
MFRKFPHRQWVTRVVTVTGLIYSWQYHVVYMYVNLILTREFLKILIINDLTYHGGKYTDIKCSGKNSEERRNTG